MKIELHMIQNFAPSCLNRDDTNSPKDCVFGGVRRARVSSQCIKRAVRRAFRDDALLPKGNLACRTKRILDAVSQKMADRKPEDCAKVVGAALAGVGLRLDEEGKSQYLLFLSRAGIDTLAAVCNKHWDVLAKATKQPAPKGDGGKATTDAKKAKKEAKQSVPEEVQMALQPLFEVKSAADLALFGRMLADLPVHNVDAACQVAHAISTNKVSMEMDFFTAVDDLKGADEDAGAGMMGVVGYNSACFYRYSVVDWEQLLSNLGGDVELARKSVEAYLRAAVSAIPTGKQNTFAAHNPPDLVLVYPRPRGAPLSLANAFVRPAAPTAQADLTQVSVDRLADYWSRVWAVYGQDGGIGPFFCGLTKPSSPPSGWQDVGSHDQVVEKTLAALPREVSA